MNSSIEISDAIKLARKLIDRTREGRLPWEAGILQMAPTKDLSGATAFTTTLEGNLRAKVSLDRQGHDEQLAFSLVEFDSRGTLLTSNPDTEVLSVAVEKDPSLGYDTGDERQLAGLLLDLYRLGRRSALKIDGSVEKALSYLDRIAV